MISGPAVHKPALHEHLCKKVDKFIGAPHDSNTIANANGGEKQQICALLNSTNTRSRSMEFCPPLCVISGTKNDTFLFNFFPDCCEMLYAKFLEEFQESILNYNLNSYEGRTFINCCVCISCRIFTCI